ncbi:MAG: hypothetical protein AAF532_08025 [Planctomycetota bacterium]
MNRSCRRRGVTLIEVAASTVLVGLLLTASLKTTAAVTRWRAIGVERAKAFALADERLQEMLSHPYSDPESPLGQYLWVPLRYNRLLFDDIDDYHDYSESPPEEVNGVDRADYADWSIRHDVHRVDPDNLSSVIGSDQGVRRVRVTVTSPAGRDYVRTTYVTRDRIRSSAEYSQNL